MDDSQPETPNQVKQRQEENAMWIAIGLVLVCALAILVWIFLGRSHHSDSMNSGSTSFTSDSYYASSMPSGETSDDRQEVPDDDAHDDGCCYRNQGPYYA